jgi:hypothetical protein
MMKLTYRRLGRKSRSSSSEQERLLKFVRDKKTVEKAVEGSMNKRIEVFHRAGFKKSAV